MRLIPGVRGRKRKQETPAAEFRRRLLAWKETPEALRPSLRALARELGTSHQLMTHYLAGLEKWLYAERYRQAKKKSDEICARAIAVNRGLTAWEVEQVHASEQAYIRSRVGPCLIDILVTGLVKDLLTPFIAAIAKQPDFSAFTFTINGSKFLHGEFINALLSFLIIASAVSFFCGVADECLSGENEERTSC